MPVSAAPWVVPDELWEEFESLVPKPVRSRPGGRRRLPDRQALQGILFDLHTGIAWCQLVGCANSVSAYKSSVQQRGLSLRTKKLAAQYPLPARPPMPTLASSDTEA